MLRCAALRCAARGRCEAALRVPCVLRGGAVSPAPGAPPEVTRVMVLTWPTLGWFCVVLGVREGVLSLPRPEEC